MKVKMYAILDTKARLYSAPSYLREDAEAIRAFDATVADQSTKLSRNPEDFAVARIASFDDQTGKIEQAADEPLVLTVGIDALGRTEQAQILLKAAKLRRQNHEKELLANAALKQRIHDATKKKAQKEKRH